MRSPRYWRRAGALALGLALVAAACGSGDSGSDGAVVAESDSASTTPALVPETSGEEAASGTDAAPAEDQATDATDATEATDATDHLFPDLDVVEVSSGATVNLAQELAGGEQAVLLWFWAPH